MSTATVAGAGTQGPDDKIRRTVKALRSAYDVDAKVLAGHLGISRNSLYNRLNGSAPWLAAEIVGLARFFGCDIIDFYNGDVRLAVADTASTTEAATGSSNRRYDSDNGVVVRMFPQARGHDEVAARGPLGRTGDVRPIAS